MRAVHMRRKNNNIIMPIRSRVNFFWNIFFSVEIVRTMQLNPNHQESDFIFS